MSPGRPEEPAKLRSFAARENGVHAITREAARDLIRSHLVAAAATGDAGEPEGPLVWLDISNPGSAEAEFLREEIGFHPLAVEDCVRGRQRPKLDRYPGYLFLVIYAASVNPERGRMALNELHIFIGARFLVTVHDSRVREVGRVLAAWREAPSRMSDVGALTHQLIDMIVDDYFLVLEHLANDVEAVENIVYQQTGRVPLAEIQRLRHELLLFRRAVAPQRDVLSTMVRRDIPFFQPALVPYFLDVHDHTIRVTEEIDALRELVSALLDAQLSSSSHQLANVMKIMTAWSIILMSMTLVAGIYGMNFAFMPELDLPWGYFAALGFMIAIGSVLVSYFRRREWL
ncbi:magnesium/cobalt transporter CorA [soil metagenome]